MVCSFSFLLIGSRNILVLYCQNSSKMRNQICYRGEFRACNKNIQIPVQSMKKKCFTTSKVKLHDEFDCLREIGHAPSVGVNLLRLCKYLCLIFQSDQYHNYHARHLEGNFKLGVYIK